MPADALNMIRRSFGRALGMQLEGPGGVGMYLFGSNQYVLYNMNDQNTSCVLRFTSNIPSTGWKELVQNETLAVSEDTSMVQYGGPALGAVALTLRPFEIAIIQAP
jgi:hypothetical protein